MLLDCGSSRGKERGRVSGESERGKVGAADHSAMRQFEEQRRGPAAPDRTAPSRGAAAANCPATGL